jgi:hypothetical protein
LTKLLTVHSVAVAGLGVHPAPAGVDVTAYELIAEPLVCSGAVHDKVTRPAAVAALVAITAAVTFNGGDVTADGIAAIVDGFEYEEPPGLVVWTEKI